jgi:anaerobic selenocysteine-containing dehydrogenase
MNARRDFLKQLMTFSVASAALLLGQNAFSQEKKKKKGETQDPKSCDAKPGVDGAATINYVEDKSKVDAATKAAADKGKALPFAKQNCGNCILFQGGVCTIITKGCMKVKNEGWCPTWTHNPAVKG